MASQVPASGNVPKMTADGLCDDSGTPEAVMSLVVDGYSQTVAMNGGTQHIAAYLAVIKAALIAHTKGHSSVQITTRANLTRQQVQRTNNAEAKHLAALRAVLDLIEQELTMKVIF